MRVKFINPSSNAGIEDWFGLNTGDNKIVLKKESVADKIRLLLKSTDSCNYDSKSTMDFIEASKPVRLDSAAVQVREGQDWEKKPTKIPGASLLKLPTFKKSPLSIAIKINPINATIGSATKKKGIIIRSGSNPKVVELAKKIEAVNPKIKEDTNKRNIDTDVFEI
jgi:hypothetical protein